MPSITSADWITVIVLVIVIIPFIVVIGLRTARPLSVQFSYLTAAAETVSKGQFGAQVPLVDRAPTEMALFANYFNSMTEKLARYERELRASHVAMAHELRSPLTAAIGRLQGMLDDVFPRDPHQLTMVMKQLQQLNQLIDELHLLSLADAGKLVLDYQPVELVGLLQERAAWLSPLAEQTGMSITVHAPGPALYEGDGLRLGQAITVLMENALRYASEGSRLEVTLYSLAQGYRIDFRDHGPGVSTEFLTSMFERFTRADSSRARHSGGSGLALSIARAICQAHGGSLQAYLPTDGGLIIRMRLPTVKERLPLIDS